MLGPGLTLNTDVKDYDGSKKSESFASLTYSIQFDTQRSMETPKVMISDEAFSTGSMRSRLLNEVKRTNEIKVEAEFTTGTGGV